MKLWQKERASAIATCAEDALHAAGVPLYAPCTRCGGIVVEVYTGCQAASLAWVRLNSVQRLPSVPDTRLSAERTHSQSLYISTFSWNLTLFGMDSCSSN